jgi:hypothetical protein
MIQMNSRTYKSGGVFTSIFIGMITCMMTTAFSAEPPHLASYWEPTRLSSRSCVERGITVLREMGFNDAHRGKSGMVAFGNRDDSHMEVICSIPRWVVFVGASPSLDQIAKYRDIIVGLF